MKIQGSPANKEWIDALRLLLHEGQEINVRNKHTKELLNYTFKIDMIHPEINILGRSVNRNFRAAEAAWILSGDNRLENIKPYCKKYAEYSDDGIFMNGAYGPPVVDQLPYILQAFKEDMSTRRAVISIWRPKPDTRSKDIPCTVSLQWIHRKGYIHCIANMRSNDIWLGTVYDMYTFSMITWWIVLELRNLCVTDFIAGTLYLNTGSLHLYRHNKDAAEAVLKVPIACAWDLENESRWQGDHECDGFMDGNELIDWLWTEANK